MRVRIAIPALAALVGLLGARPAVSQAPPAAEQHETDLSTSSGKYPLYVTAEYLGMAGLKTVLRVRLRAPELSMAAGRRGLTSFSGELQGNFLKGSDVVQSFKYSVSGEIGTKTTFTYAFLRSIEPGAYTLKLTLLAPGGRQIGDASTELSVPEVGAKFRPDMAPSEASTLPSAEAVVIADEAENAASPGESKLKILPPVREAPIGLLRLEADVQPPITKVEFYLEDKLIVSRTRPPYSVEIDLGDVPRRQTVRAVGYDSTGRVIDEDAWSVNQGSARLAVKILPSPNPSGGDVSGQGRRAVDRRRRRQAGRALSRQPEAEDVDGLGPYEITIPFAEYSKADFLRATAIGDDGKEANDIHFLKGPNTTVETVRVDVVQLHVSALDKDKRFVKGLAESDFKIAGGRPPADDHGLRGGGEAADHGRARRGRFRLDGEVDAVRPRRVGGALPRPDPRQGQGIRHRVPRAAAHDPGADERFRVVPACVARDVGPRRDGALRLDRARPLPVPDAAGAQGPDRHLRRRRQPLPRRLPDAAALRALRRRADLLHRRRDLGPRLRHPQGDRRDLERVRRRGVSHLERRQDRRGHQAHRGGASLAVHRRVPHGFAEARRRVPTVAVSIDKPGVSARTIKGYIP